ncbi:hypothetical protein D5F01_LYC24204 [Larimichthys crocea]|uniref:Uncharacterized protein n=1 Tax=Larimichthys crocea TaxID=215358 RepID=A0A6G0HEX0_LARCR|nr:hypothetical protein D5F01_LYC24204 [Larimichthys crocea]
MDPHLTRFCRDRGQRSEESACSYAIAPLRAVEDIKRGGKPFPDRDSKVTRQFLRGLNDEEVYMRIAPKKPRLLSFRELQDELRNLAKETKKFQSSNKSKKTYAQVKVASECTLNAKAEKGEHTSECSAFKRLEPMVTGATMGTKQQDPPPQVKKTGDGKESTL